MTDLRESREYQRGRAGELIVARWLKERECYVIPSYDYSGKDGNKAPRLEGLWTGHPVPDLDVARSGHRFWVEVKTKWEAALWRQTGELRHGIELRLLEHYQAVEKISGCPCWLFIYEESTGHLLAQTITKLGQPHTGTALGKRMAYWPRVKFRHLHTFKAQEGAA